MHLYLLAPDRSAVAGMGVPDAGDPNKLLPFLQQTIFKMGWKPGPTAIKPHTTSRPPASPSDSFIVHLVSRALTGGSWHEFPAENWIVLSAAEAKQLLPGSTVAPKKEWVLPKPVAVKLAEWIYPQNEEKTGVNRSRVDLADFRLVATTVEGPLVRARIHGKIRLWHSFYPGGMNEQNAQDIAASEITGYMDFDQEQGRIQRLRIVTTKADYHGDTPFAASLVSMSKETLDALQ